MLIHQFSKSWLCFIQNHIILHNRFQPIWPLKSVLSLQIHQVFRFSFEKRMTKFAWKFARMFFVVVVVALRRKYFSSLLWFPWKSISTQNHYGLNIDLFTNQRLNNPIRIRCLLSLTLSPGVIPSSLVSSFVMICKLVREQYKDYCSCDLMRLLKVRIGENSPLHFPCLDWKLKQWEDLCATVSLQPRNPDWAVS